MWGGLDVHSALLIFVGGLAASVSFELWRVRSLGIGMSNGEKRNPSEYRGVVRHLWIGDSANILLQRADVVVVGFALGLDEVALYLVAQRIAVLSTFFLDAIRIALGPKIARSYKSADDPSFRQVIANSAFLIFTFGVIGAGLVLGFGWPILWLHNDAFTSAYWVLLVLVFGHLSLAVMGPTALIMSMTDLERERSWITAGAACLMVIVVSAGSYMFGTVGAASGAAIAMWLNNASLCLVIWKRKSIWPGIMNPDARSLFYPANIYRWLDGMFKPARKSIRDTFNISGAS